VQLTFMIDEQEGWPSVRAGGRRSEYSQEAYDRCCSSSDIELQVAEVDHAEVGLDELLDGGTEALGSGLA
jgi:hypothetical protein